jgi:hypothetical protein
VSVGLPESARIPANPADWADATEPVFSVKQRGPVDAPRLHRPYQATRTFLNPYEHYLHAVVAFVALPSPAVPPNGKQSRCGLLSIWTMFKKASGIRAMSQHQMLEPNSKRIARTPSPAMNRVLS